MWREKSRFTDGRRGVSLETFPPDRLIESTFYGKKGGKERGGRTRGAVQRLSCHQLWGKELSGVQNVKLM